MLRSSSADIRRGYADTPGHVKQPDSHGLYVSNGPVVVENNIVAGVTGYGIHFYSTPCQGVISNNTLVRIGNSDILYAGGDCRAIPSGNGTISNNILGPNASYGLQLGALGGGTDPCSSSHPNLVANNLFSGNASGQVGQAASCTTVTGSKSEAPTTTFVSYAGSSSDNFHIRAESQAVNGGTRSCTSGGQNPCTPATDIVSVTRSSTTPTIGAYEYGGATVTPPSAPASLTVTVH